MRPEHPHIFHLVQSRLWDPVAKGDGSYYPPTYEADGFTHATANPKALLKVANHFYRDVPGDWYCLRMTEESLRQTGVETIWEGTAPVGDIKAEFEGANDELFPHLFGGIHPAAVLEVLPVERAPDGTFLAVSGVTD